MNAESLRHFSLYKSNTCIFLQACERASLQKGLQKGAP